MGGYSMSSSGGYGGSSGSYGSGPNVIQAAVISKQTIDYRDVDVRRQITPQIIEVNAGVLPLTILFKSASSRLNVMQSHEGSQGGEESTSSEDEPYRLIHKVKKPIIQEVHEIITPYRRVIQEIHPVEEEVKTIVARGRDVSDYGSMGYGNGISNGYSSSSSSSSSGGGGGGSYSGGGSYGRSNGKSY
jgi:hypothetical protein